MIYIILAIVTSVFLLSVFKLFTKYSINTFHAIVVNYITAAITGFLFSDNKIDYSLIQDTPWIYICIPLGALFISIFYLISLTAQKISIAAASVSNKMSVILPVLFSVIYIGEKLNALKVAGIVLALIAVYFTTANPGQRSQHSKKLLWLPVLVFIGSGILDISINAASTYLFTRPVHSELFSISAFACAFLFGLCTLLFLFVKNKINKTPAKPFELKSLAAGVILGIPNYFSIFFIIKSLEASVLNSAQLFPVLNISNVTLSAIIGFMVFKEKLSVQNIIGVALAIISIILIAF